MNKQSKGRKEKTTVSIYFSAGRFYRYVGYLSGFCSISFTGTHSKYWTKKWNEFRTKKVEELRASFEGEKAEKIKKLEDELLITVDGWFSKKRKILREKINDEKDRKFQLSEWGELHLIYEFLPNDCAKISDGDKTTIYEILS